MTRSAPFDRVAGIYDRTRAYAPEAAAEVTRLLAAEVAGRRCLEVGVGTGRVAAPLAREGVDLVGIDLSEGMLGVLCRDHDDPFPVAVADAARLPFPDRSFGAGLAVHVLHLVADRERVVDELLRVVDGPVLVSAGRPDDRLLGLRRRFLRLAGHGATDTSTEVETEVDAAFAARGAAGRDLPPVANTTVTTRREVLASYRDGVWSWTWPLAEDERRRAHDRLVEELDDLDAPVTLTTTVAFRAYEGATR